MGGGASRVALDIGAVCPQAASHLGVAAGERLGASEGYVRTKCARADIERRCRVAGIVFQPMIFESFGGGSVDAERVLKCTGRNLIWSTPPLLLLRCSYGQPPPSSGKPAAAALFGGVTPPILSQGLLLLRGVDPPFMAGSCCC